MAYEVDWTDEALDDLAAIWTRAANRDAVTAAQVSLDRMLAMNPKRHGRPQSEGLYVVDAPPLRAQFEVSEANHVVSVVSVSELH